MSNESKNDALKNDIFSKISLGRTKEALTLLKDFLEGEFRRSKSIQKEVTILQNRFSRLSENKRLGILNNSEYEVELNKINKTILEIVDILSQRQEGSIQGKFNFSVKYIITILCSVPIMISITFFAINYIPQEKEDFLLSIKKNSKKELENFLIAYPKSEYKPLVKEKLDSIENSKLINALIKEDITSLDNLLKEYPNGKFNEYILLKKNDLSIRPILKFDISLLDGDYSIYDNGNKIIIDDGMDSKIKLIDIRNKKMISIDYRRSVKKYEGGIIALGLSRNGDFLGYYNLKTKGIYIHSTKDGKLLIESKCDDRVTKINISNDSKNIIVHTEGGRYYYLNSNTNSLDEIKTGGKWHTSTHFIEKNRMIILGDWDDFIKITSPNGETIFNTILYPNNGWIAGKPIFLENDKYMILPTEVHGENACEYQYKYNFNVYNLDKGEFLYSISNEKFIKTNQNDYTKSLLSFSDNYIFKRSLEDGRILDTISAINTNETDFIFKRIDINNQLIAYSYNTRWDKVQFWDYKNGERLWGIGTSENIFCPDKVSFLNEKYVLTENDDYIKVWKTADILEKKN